jgi:hypothetical protein
MRTYWISFEHQATEEWLGTLIVDADDIPLDDETGHLEVDACEALITSLGERGLIPEPGSKWNIRVQKLPSDVAIPEKHKWRLITDERETASLGGVMISRHGTN